MSLTDKRKDPSFSMGAKFQTENTKLNVPGAGSYNPKPETTKLRAAGWRIGTENRPSMVQKGQKFVPGAGSYAIPSRIQEGPRVGMHARTDTVDQNVKKGIPGPGSYDLMASPGAKNRRSPAYSLGSGSRIDMANTKATKFIPGPGNYTASDTFYLKKSAPNFGFGTSKRPDITGPKKINTPGPGAYKLVSKISNVADF